MKSSRIGGIGLGRFCKLLGHLLPGTELPDSRSDSVPGSGQCIQEEQPAPVVAAVARLDAASR